MSTVGPNKAPPTPAMVERWARRWRWATWAVVPLLVATSWLDWTGIGVIFACLLLIVHGERAECLGWLAGWKARGRADQ